MHKFFSPCEGFAASVPAGYIVRDGWIHFGLSTVCYHLDPPLDHLLHCPPLPTIAGSWALGKLLTQPSSPFYIVNDRFELLYSTLLLSSCQPSFLEKIFFDASPYGSRVCVESGRGGLP